MNKQLHSVGTQAERAEAVGLMRKLMRWAVLRPRMMTFLLVLLVLGACSALCWLGLKEGLSGDAAVSTGLVTFRFFDAAGWVCLAGAGLWLLLWGLFCATSEPVFPGTRSWHFGLRQHQRIFEGHALEPGLIGTYGCFGLAGFALGLALVLKLAAAIGCGDSAVTEGNPLFFCLLALPLLLVSGRLVRDVLFLWDFEYFVGDKAREYAQAMINKAQRETEADEEYERKTVRGGPHVLLLGGFLGGLLLSARLFSERDSIAVVQGSISGLILSAAGLHLLKTRPRCCRLWLALVILLAIGFLVFTQMSWGGSLLCQMLGILWGVAVGTAGTLLYLRQLNTKPR